MKSLSIQNPAFLGIPKAIPLYFIDDFSTNKFDYTDAGSVFSYAVGQLNYNVTASSGNKFIFFDMGASIGIGNENWYLDYTFLCSAYSGSGNTVGVALGIAQDTPSGGDPNDEYNLEILGDTSKYSYGSANDTFGDMSYTWAVGTTYFIRFKVNVTTKVMTLKSYASAADRTADISPLMNGSITPATNANNARYVYVWTDRPTNGFTMSGNIKDIVIDKQSNL